MKKAVALVFSLSFLFSNAQEIYPIPQKVKKESSITYTGINSLNISVQDFYVKKGLKIKETVDNKIPVEGYQLSISKKNIQIKYSTPKGQFYAYKTLNQILVEAKKTGKLPTLQLEDFPDVAYRGTVEGFYGQPWSHENRISQLKFYGDWKLNTYIYGPKDDPYHSSPKWREAYPTAEAEKLKSLVNIAKENHVNFYWAIHPGLDIKWNDEDRKNVLQKFEMMYQLGIRHFAVFFDDISGEGTKAEKQADLLNYLQKEFVEVKKDVGPLIMCPTEYNKSWSNPKEGTYLDILGQQLNPKVHIMWTGNTVIHDIKSEDQKWVNNRIKRPSFVWWNFPVSDYVRNHLLLGAAYGLDTKAKNDMSGFVSNPMDKPEASKVAIFSIANYSWNPETYNADKSWASAIEVVLPEVEKEYKIFSNHNADPGPSYHNYRRNESEEIGKILEPITQNLIQNKFNQISPESYEKLKAEFNLFKPSSDAILKNAKNKNLVKEIEPWLEYFGAQGEVALSLLEVYQANNYDELYKHFITFQNNKEKLIEIDQRSNKNQWQPGVVTASKYVLPWIEQSYVYFQKVLRKTGYQVKDAINMPIGTIYTNISNLKTLPVQNDIMTGNKAFQLLKLNKTLEFIPFNPNDYIGIEIKTNSNIKEVKYKLDQKNENLKIQYSIYGNEWKTYKITNAKFIRLVNTSTTNQTAKIEQFDIVFE